jgi:hypothetical protein
MCSSHKVVVKKLLRSPWAADAEPDITNFCSCDQTSVAIATARATFFKDVQIDVDALEQGLTIVLEDLPFLSGR